MAAVIPAMDRVRRWDDGRADPVSHTLVRPSSVALTSRLWEGVGAVHLLFVDESGKSSDSLFAVGGIAIDGNRWHELHDA